MSFEGVYKRWDEFTPEEQRDIIRGLEELTEEERIALFKEDPWAEKVWLEKRPKPIGAEFCPEGLVDVKDMPREFWRPSWPELYEAYDKIGKGWLWFCKSTGWFFEKVDEKFRRLTPLDMARILRRLRPPEELRRPIEERYIEAPRVEVTAPVRRLKVPAAAFFNRYPEVIQKMIEERLTPNMTPEEIISLIESLYGWKYDEYKAAAWYYYHCLKRKWPIPEWVKKALGL